MGHWWGTSSDVPSAVCMSAFCTHTSVIEENNVSERREPNTFERCLKTGMCGKNKDKRKDY